MTKTEKKMLLYKKLLPETLELAVFSRPLFGGLDEGTLKYAKEQYRKYFEQHIEADAKEFLLTTTKSAWIAGAKRKGFAVQRDNKTARRGNVTITNMDNNHVSILYATDVIKKFMLFDWKKVSVDYDALWYNGEKITDL